MADFACLLCTNAGRPTLAPRKGRLSLCVDCYDGLRASGRSWCQYGRHAAPEATMRTRLHLCKPCDAQRRRDAYARNAEAERAASRARYYADPTKHHARVTAWRKANPQRWNRYCAAWRKRNREKQQAIRRRHYLRHREVMLEAKRLYRARVKLRILRGLGR